LLKLCQVLDFKLIINPFYHFLNLLLILTPFLEPSLVLSNPCFDNIDTCFEFVLNLRFLFERNEGNVLPFFTDVGIVVYYSQRFVNLVRLQFIFVERAFQQVLVSVPLILSNLP